MHNSIRGLGERLKRSLWPAIIPTFVLLVLALSLTAVTNADTMAAAQADADAIAHAQPGKPVCESCHEETGVIWENSTHARTGKVTCESCHGEYKEGHPKAETMILPMESETCHGCHAAAFAEWEQSLHGQKNLDCYDCHPAHTQGLRLPTEEELCSSCHSDVETELAHAVHDITAVNCSGCHMAVSEREKAEAASEGVSVVSNHSFTVASDVCIRCHSSAAAATESGTGGAPTRGETTRQLQVANERIEELETQVNTTTAQAAQLRRNAIVGMGLTMGIGGFLGLVIGFAGALLISWRPR